MAKIDIISGFLGAGKTTLIKKLLAEAYAGEKLVLIENEFGEISIDGGFVQDSGVQISEMSSGCICCSLVGDFGRALVDVEAQFHPDRILIEPSGVGKLSDVIRAVQEVAEDDENIRLNSFITVVDAAKCKAYMKNFGEFFNDQVESAQCIILSRTGKLSEEKLAAAVALLREKNASATIITTPWEQLTGAQILSAMESNSAARVHELAEEMEEHHHHHHHHDHDECDDPDCECHHHHDHDGHHHHHHADEVFTSWGVETPKSFAAADIERILTALDSGEYGQVVRCKGIVPMGGGKWLHFDYVPEEHDVREGTADVTGRLCVIGAKLDEAKLAALFGV